MLKKLGLSSLTDTSSWDTPGNDDTLFGSIIFFFMRINTLTAFNKYRVFIYTRNKSDLILYTIRKQNLWVMLY